MRLVTNSFAPLARIFGKSEYFLYRLSLSRQLSATLSATACKYLAAVGRGHTLTEAVLLGALTLLRLERSLHNFVHLPVLKFTDGHRHRSGARRGHMPLPVCMIGYDIYYPILVRFCQAFFPTLETNFSSLHRLSTCCG